MIPAKFIRLILIFQLCFATTLFAKARRFNYPSGDFLLVIGDIHGDPVALVNILLSNGMIDAEGNWIAKNGHVVFLGDTIAKGPDSLTCLDIIIDMKRKALEKNSPLLVNGGNHETNIYENDLSNFISEDFQRFKELGARKYMDIGKILADPNLPYAAEIADRPFFIRIGRYGFVHAGLEEWTKQFTADYVNAWMRSYQDRNQKNVMADIPYKNPNELLTNETGPHWSRRMSRGDYSQAEFDSIIGAWGVSELWVGHEPTDNSRPQTTYNGKYHMQDTAISSGMGGQIWCAFADKNGLAQNQFQQRRFARDNPKARKLVHKYREKQKQLYGVYNLRRCK